MTRFRTIAMAVLALSMAGIAQGEGDGPRARARLLEQKQAAKAAQRVEPAGSLSLRSLAKDASPSCPPKNASVQAWKAWRDDRIAELLTMQDKSKDVRESYLDNEDVMAQATIISKALAACEGAPPPEARMGNFLDFVTAHRNADYQSDLRHQFGHQAEDKDYLSVARPQLEVPCLLKSAPFLEYVSHPRTYRKALGLIEEQNLKGEAAGCKLEEAPWTTLIYRSRFLTTPDYAETFGRFFVLVPAKNTASYDRWIQFGIWLPEDSKRYDDVIHNMSVVSVASGDPFQDGRFDAVADWWRVAKDGEPGTDLIFRRQTPPYETDNCIRCHKTLPIGIHPKAVYQFKGDQLVRVAGHKQLDGLKPAPVGGNKQMYEAGPVEVVAALANYIFNAYDRPPKYHTSAADTVAMPKNYGPEFGPDSGQGAPARTPETLRSCTSRHGLNEVSVQRVIKNMNCAECHSGAAGGYGILNYPLATEKRTRLRDDKSDPNIIRTRILSGSMPLTLPDGEPAKLSHQERSALYDCLSEEYFKPNKDPSKSSGLLVDWLKGNEKPLASVSPTVPVAPTGLKAKAVALPFAAASAAVAGVPPAIFKDECMKCHTETATAKAPSLMGVFMRPLASLPLYSKYSAALKETAALKDEQGNPLVWDEANLMAYLADTNAFVSGKLNKPAESNMRKRYADEAFRRTIVQYLMTLK